MNELFSALSQAQGEFPVIPKTKKVTKKGFSKKTGKEFEYDYYYAPYEEIVKQISPILKKHSLGFFHNFEATSEASGIMKTVVFHSSGQSIESNHPVKLSQGGMQELGSDSTYAKRYSLSLALGVSTDDDLDANETKQEEFKAEIRGFSTSSPKDMAKEQSVAISKPEAFKVAPQGQSTNYGEVIIPFGKNKGKSLNSVPESDAKGCVDWAKSKGKFTDFATKGTLYLQELQLKTSDLVPDFDNSDELPF